MERWLLSSKINVTKSSALPIGIECIFMDMNSWFMHRSLKPIFLILLMAKLLQAKLCGV